MSKSFDPCHLLTRCVVSISREKVFYGHILKQIERVHVESGHEIKTAAVGRKEGDRLIKLYWNDDFMANLVESRGMDDALACCRTILEHEVLHIVFGHIFMKFSDPKRANVASDLAVNSFLPACNLPGGLFAVDYGLPDGKCVSWYYDNLAGNPVYMDQCLSGLLDDQCSKHKLWENIENDDVFEAVVRDMISQAVSLCDSDDFGDLPSDVVDSIRSSGDSEDHKIPWSRVLRNFCNASLDNSVGYTSSRISKRFGYRPGTKVEERLNLAVAIDTSASVSKDVLASFFSEIRSIWRTGASVSIYECDCVISDRSPISFDGSVLDDVSGRGGTDLEPVLSEVEGKYDALVYFTDFQAPVVSRKYNISTLWVLTSDVNPSEYPYPWGIHIRMDV